MPAVPPRPAPRELTMPAPYRLRSEARGAEAVSHLQAELEREEEERRRAAEFKVGDWRGCQVWADCSQTLQRHTPLGHDAYTHSATPFPTHTHPHPPTHTQARPIWSGKPFVVHDSDAPLTVPAPIHLATEERAGSREEFDRTVAQRLQQQQVGSRGCLAAGIGLGWHRPPASGVLTAAELTRFAFTKLQEERRREEELRRQREEEEAEEYQRSHRFRVRGGDGTLQSRLALPAQSHPKISYVHCL
jgi:hypothetical protein